MAFAITEVDNPFPTAMWCPSVTKTYADQSSGAQSAIDFGAAVFQNARVIIYIKTPPSATNVITATLQAGTGASCTNPVNIAQGIITMVTGDTAMYLEIRGVYQGLFRSFILTVTTSANSIVYDAQVDVC
jgi:hypothetical protein